MEFKIMSDEEIRQGIREKNLCFALEKFGYTWEQTSKMSHKEKVDLFNKSMKRFYG